MKFTLEALQANDGDCLLLHYAPTGGKPVRVLIDGGSGGVYNAVIKRRLDELRAGGTLDLRMAMVSHIDSDHITGILDLLKALKNQEDDGAEPFCRIRTLWHNSFKKLTGGKTAPASVESAAVAASLEGKAPAGLDVFTKMVVASVPQGNQLRDFATQLVIPINEGADGDLVRAPAHGKKVVPIAEGLTFTVLAPHDDQLKRLEAEWKKAKKKKATPAAQAADYLNNTVPNMSSIVVLAEAKPHTMLLTGDARGDVILEALDLAGLAKSGKSHFDLLKVQHHGSNHSTTQEFFERVTADRYVISGNGEHGIPHPDALGWLSAARHGESYDAYLTNRSGGSGLTKNLDKFLAQEKAKEPKHRYHFREKAALSISVDLA